MSRQRTLRRAAERAAQKSFTATASVAIDLPQRADSNSPGFREANPPISEARWQANLANARRSTGPITEEGKARSSRNALKHGLTGVTVLLDSDDAALYQAQLDGHVEQFRPVGFEECRLVQSMHDCAWRLDRILMMESAIYARGRMELAGCNQEQPGDQRQHFLLLDISERFDKQLRNLHFQESRLQRQRAKDLKALRELQTQRRTEEQAAAAAAAEAAKQAPCKTPVGFDFSTPEIEENTTPATPTEPYFTPPGKEGN